MPQNLHELIENFHRSIENLRREHEIELNELKTTREQVKNLEKKLEEQTAASDAREKLGLRFILAQNSTTDSNEKFQRIRNQLKQFEEIHFETDEQIRLLRKSFDESVESSSNFRQSLTVKRSDLAQQTQIVEKLLEKHEEQILQRLNVLLGENSTFRMKSKKKKRLWSIFVKIWIKKKREVRRRTKRNRRRWK